jgi:hypothetical protein
MFNFIKIILSVFLISMSGSIFAGINSDNGTIKKIWLHESYNAVVVTFSEAIKNPDSCEAANAYVVEFDGNDFDGNDQGQRIYSALLAASMSGREVSFWINGCTTEKYWDKTYPKVKSINVYFD